MMPRGLPRGLATCILAILSASTLLSLGGCSEDAGPAGPVDDRPNPYDEFDGPDPREVHGLETFELSDLPYPPHNSPSEPGFEKRLELGRFLYFDQILSGKLDTSCGSCHHPAMAWQDGVDLSAGVSGTGFGPERVLTDENVMLMPRNTPTAMNLGFNSAEPSGPPSHRGLMLWDGRTAGLERQSLQPTATIDEMSYHLPNHGVYTYSDSAAADTMVTRLQQIDEYVDLFAQAFPLEASEMSEDTEQHVIRKNTLERALAAYQRELVTIDSPYDQWVRGDDRALTIEQLRGADLFYGKANCAACHSGPMFSDFSFSRIGVADNPRAPGRYPVERGGNGVDIGRMEHTSNPEDVHRYRVPPLRNVALTGPWFRHGTANSLRDVVIFHLIAGVPPDPATEPERAAIYDQYMGRLQLTRTPGPILTPELLDDRLVPIDLTDQEIDDLVAFMHALTDRTIDGRSDPTVPERVPSGSPVVEARAPFSMVPLPEHVDAR